MLKGEKLSAAIPNIDALTECQDTQTQSNRVLRLLANTLSGFNEHGTTLRLVICVPSHSGGTRDLGRDSGP